MSKRFGFITWRSHPNEKYLDNDFWNLIQPMLAKSNRYLVALEEQGTPCAHYHIMLEFVGDLTHLKQKFNTKSFKLFFQKIKVEKLETKLDIKFTDGCLNLKLVEKTEEDFYHTIGYICKDNLKYSKGFTDEEVTIACKYYHTVERQNNPDAVQITWKIPNVKTIHSFLEHYSKKWEMKINDPHFKLKLTEEHISMKGVSKQTLKEIFIELIYANHRSELDEDDLGYYKNEILSETDMEYDVTGPEGVTVAGGVIQRCAEMVQRVKYLENILQKNNIGY